MKKAIFVLVLLFFLAILVAPSFAQPDQDIRVIVNNKLVDFSDSRPFINKDLRTMVPIRFISNELGASVHWDGPARTVSIGQRGKTIVLVIGNTFAHVNGQRVAFDTAAEIVEGRTMVPLRFISETFGAQVSWDGRLKTVYITSTPAEPQPPPALATVTLYFADSQAQYLVAERREVPLSKPSLAELVFDELLAGPRRPDLLPTIPAGTRLRSLIMFREIAQLNLSAQFRENYTGGSAFEQMALYSIVNSLTELSGINSVFFLLENVPQPAILGHIDTSQPLTRRPDLIRDY